ncbi:hypothetical protein CsatB_023129 [Cannabis sativa]
MVITKHGMISSTCKRTPFLTLDKTLSAVHDYISHPYSNTLSSALQHYIDSDNPYHGRKIHAHVIKTGYEPNTNISIKLLILHLKCGCLTYARQMFDEMPHRTLSAYNYIIGGYLRQGQVEESLSLVRRLVLSGENPDGYTFSMILKASTSASYVPYRSSLGKIVHAQIIKSDVGSDNVLYTALVASYVKSGKIGYARAIFELMLERNVVCSTSLITGYMNQGDFDEAKDIFSKTIDKDIVVFNAMIEGYSKLVEHASKSLDIYIQMQRLNFRPNISTFASVIGACSMLTAFEVAEQVQSQLMKTEFFTHIKMGSALIDMYSKCGRIEDARKVFDHMPEKNVFSWTSMIDGYGKNGYPYDALELFGIMQEHHHIDPNFVTFLGALSACSHAGLVDKGLEIFRIMEAEYFLKPKMEHYACVVDLLGRAGRLSQAWEFVKAMPEKPNSDVWAALLSSSRLHGYVEMASIAANELFKLNANDRPGAYIALSNTLADAGKWDSVSEIRDKMKVRGVSKDTGCSWVAAEFSL